MGKGIDRHLMGLYILAHMTGVSPMPSIFTEKGYLVSKQYKLSTSNISMGDSPIFGVYQPLCLVRRAVLRVSVDSFAGWVCAGGFMAMYEDGYGVCYALTDKDIKFSITANNNCAATSAAKFKDALEQSLIDMQRLCLSRNVIYLGPAKM